MLEQVHRRRLALPGTGIEIAVLDWGGEGPLALLHHANGFCAGVWGPVARELGRHYRVLAMDARGHGDSSRPEDAASYRWEHFGEDAIGVAETLAAEHPSGRIALGLGHSFGGTALLAASARRPGLFERLALVDPIVPPPPGGPASELPRSRREDLAGGARRRRHLWSSRAEARARWQKKRIFADWHPEALSLYAAEGLRERPDGRVELKCPGEVEAAIFEASGDLDVWTLASEVRVPVLIQRAARGDFPRGYYESLAATMEDARVCDVEAGHLVPMERPDLVADAVLRFAGHRSGR